MDKVEFYNNMLINAYEGIYFVDDTRQITFWNGGAENITGFQAGEVFGKHCADNLLNHVDQNGKSLCLDGCPLHLTLQDGIIREAKVFLHHKDGHLVPVTIRSIPVREDDRIVGAVELFIDDSEKHDVMRDAETYKILAMVDQLTELPNRRHIQTFLTSKYNECKELGMQFGILFMDVDHFKQFNDHYGHDVGDQVLTMISKTLLASTRATDLIGRFGGEEFIAVLAGVDEATLIKKAEQLRMLVENCALAFHGRTLKVTMSVGASLIQEGDTVETLLKRADEMLYASKENGRNMVTYG